MNFYIPNFFNTAYNLSDESNQTNQTKMKRTRYLSRCSNHLTSLSKKCKKEEVCLTYYSPMRTARNNIQHRDLVSLKMGESSTTGNLKNISHLIKNIFPKEIAEKSNFKTVIHSFQKAKSKTNKTTFGYLDRFFEKKFRKKVNSTFEKYENIIQKTKAMLTQYDVATRSDMSFDGTQNADQAFINEMSEIKKLIKEVCDDIPKRKSRFRRKLYVALGRLFNSTTTSILTIFTLIFAFTIPPAAVITLGLMAVAFALFSFTYNFKERHEKAWDATEKSFASFREQLNLLENYMNSANAMRARTVELSTKVQVIDINNQGLQKTVEEIDVKTVSLQKTVEEIAVKTVSLQKTVEEIATDNKNFHGKFDMFQRQSQEILMDSNASSQIHNPSLARLQAQQGQVIQQRFDEVLTTQPKGIINKNTFPSTSQFPGGAKFSIGSRDLIIENEALEQKIKEMRRSLAEVTNQRDEARQALMEEERRRPN